MNLSYLIKATPFLSTLVLIIFLSISNQKEYIYIFLSTKPKSYKIDERKMKCTCKV